MAGQTRCEYGPFDRPVKRLQQLTADVKMKLSDLKCTLKVPPSPSNSLAQETQKSDAGKTSRTLYNERKWSFSWQMSPWSVRYFYCLIVSLHLNQAVLHR